MPSDKANTHLSRRAVLVAASAAPLLGGGSTAAAATGLGTTAATALATSLDRPEAALVVDEVTRRCNQFLALEARIRRLQTRWGRLESWLDQEHGWMRLTQAERSALPQAKELRDIDGMLDALFEKRNDLLDELPSTEQVSLDGVIAKLAVVETLLWREDFPAVYELITQSRQDLITMFGAAGAHGPVGDENS